ncbi:unnamed protein product [Rotaria sordida]|uniref:tRNA (uracil(54)-C(5))-methyltransferase n=1 Tax=Rotaria sordida TaxID=392033 RepID=A0A819P898_9BILA|nr:unnamed protein product [Rotaria sordida]CAF0960375.1 unnamed protein product [Rotaria sordida]CAF1317625.1 unnamed protein product [Rotaria sordida]CAF4012329.1 unnamed protein product [Rotaria sordida]
MDEEIETPITDEIIEPSTEPKTEEKGYLARDEYTSERFKLELNNLPKYFGFGDLKKKLKLLGVNFVKIKVPKSATHAYVNFRNEEDREKGLKLLNGWTYRGNKIEVSHAKPATDVMFRSAKPKKNDDKRNHHMNNQNDSDLPDEIKIQNSATPLWNLSYEEQLIKKSTIVQEFLKGLEQKIKETSSKTVTIPFEGIKPSPVIDGYRNKCEFSCGKGNNNEDKVVGFRYGEYRYGIDRVGSPNVCKNVSDKMKLVVQHFQDHIRSRSSPWYSAETHLGCWRQLTVRTSRLNHLMIMISFCQGQLSPEEIDEEKKALLNYFTHDAGSICKVTNIFFNVEKNKAGNEIIQSEILLGESYIIEKLFDFQFHISAKAFFQANTQGAEVLYSLIKDSMKLDNETIVLDICCGTGTIGITLANNVKHVIGIEMNKDAVEDAKRNAQLNNINNIDFIAEKIESIIHKLVKKYDQQRLIAILDPPRAGVHRKVIQTLRSTENIKVLGYVACNPQLATHNLIDLTRPQSRAYQGEPFEIITTTAVDLFPHTPHYELFILFQR